MRQALSAQRMGAIGEAKRLYELVLRLDPSSAAACGNLAIIAARQGDLDAAEMLMRRQIGLQPAHAGGHNNLGSLLQQRGRPAEAVFAHRHAIKLDPNHAEAHLALGNALRQQHHLDDALRSYIAAAALRPAYAEAHNNAGVVLQMLGRFEEAVSAYRKAIAAHPSYAEATFNLGSVLHAMGKLEGAEAAYTQVLALDPMVAVAHNNLGAVLKDQDRPDAALAAFDRAIALDADHAEAHYNRATVLQQQARRQEALVAYRRAIALRPDYVDAVNNAGIVLQELGRSTEAIELYHRLARPLPDHADLHNNLGTALLADGRIEAAILSFGEALACRPDFPEAAYNRGNAFREAGRLAEAIAAWEHALALRMDYPDALGQLAHHRALACQWDQREADQAKLVAMVRDGIRVPPFYLLTTPATAEDQLRAARQWVVPFQPPYQARFEHRRCPTNGKRLRLGYLSADFHQHATSQLIAGLLERHDRDRFEIFAYSHGPDDDSPMRARLRGAFDRFVDIADLSHDEAASRIHQDHINILIDLKGYTHRSRPMIAAFRPAPIQVSYLGFPATMGADFIDYILADRLVVPEGDQIFFAEKVVHLPICYQPSAQGCEVALPTSRRDHGLPEHGLVLCCFNNSYKLSPAMFDVWMRLLDAKPGAVLWLLATNELAQANLRKEAAARGVDSARLVFAPIVPSTAHIERHRHADLFLDTVPCNAHTTASDALWGGLPVLTCSGDTFAGRVASSLLDTIGLPELVTPSLTDYEWTARALIDAPDRLRELRERIERKRDANSLFDVPGLTRAIEAAYERMWQRWLVGQEPRPFAIENERTKP